MCGEMGQPRSISPWGRPPPPHPPEGLGGQRRPAWPPGAEGGVGDVPPPGRDVVTNRARSDPAREAARRAAMYNFNVFCQKERKIKPCCKEPPRALSVLHAEVGRLQLLLPGLELSGGFSTEDAEIRAYVAPVQSCWKC